MPGRRGVRLHRDRNQEEFGLPLMRPSRHGEPSPGIVAGCPEADPWTEKMVLLKSSGVLARL